MEIDFLIIGQGLAGTLLGFELIKAQKKVFFIDFSGYQKSSEVAAGIVNPVVFRRLTKSWMIDKLYPQLLETYAQLESMLGEPFFFPLKIRKVFQKGDPVFWEKKVLENSLEPYLSLMPDYSGHRLLMLPHGSGWVEKGGRVNLKRLLTTFRTYLISQNLILQESFDFDLLKAGMSNVHYKEIDARKIIFCEGHRASENPFFKEIIYKHTKGEILDLEIDNYQSDDILNKTIFLMPAGENRFRLGATYDWDHLDEIPTAFAKKELTSQLSQFLKTGFRVTGHQAGIRPTTHDRRPVAGLHPVLQTVGILNGLGSKGCILAPYFAKMFANYLCGEIKSISPEINVARYFPGEK